VTIIDKKILFIGDSITEDGRFDDEANLGLGYVRMIHDDFLQKAKHLNVINKGISGDRITDLHARWQRDVIQEQPDYLSISIGINDVWRQLDQPAIAQVYPAQFQEIYHNLLDQVIKQTKAEIILMEPTIIEENPLSQGNQLLTNYIKIIHSLSKEYKTIQIPLHQACLDFIQDNPKTPLTRDGVHMNDRGRMLMATCWLDTVKKELALS